MDICLLLKICTPFTFNVVIDVFGFLSIYPSIQLSIYLCFIFCPPTYFKCFVNIFKSYHGSLFVSLSLVHFLLISWWIIQILPHASLTFRILFKFVLISPSGNARMSEHFKTLFIPLPPFYRCQVFYFPRDIITFIVISVYPHDTNDLLYFSSFLPA